MAGGTQKMTREQIQEAVDYINGLAAQERREGDAPVGSPQHRCEIAKAEGCEEAAEYLRGVFALDSLDDPNE